MTEPETPGPEKPGSDAKAFFGLFAPHVAVSVLGLVLGLAGVLYVMKPAGKESQIGACPASSFAAAQRMKPVATGEVAALVVDGKPSPAPDLTFEGPDGKPMTLASLRGKTLLVNLWATWCAPCRKEMPDLARLQTAMGSDAFEVVALNLDTRNLERRKPFLEEVGASNLTFYADPAGRVLPQMRASAGVLGLPTTLVIDPAGCRLGMMQGEARWDSDDAKALVRAALGQ